MALMALMALTACDRAERKDFREEREDRLYREAMNDYQSGRIEAAVKGFEKAVRNNPANASARFQLACLLQDAKRDYLGAFCGFREYLLQHPDSDKSKLARDRLALCEKEIAKLLSVKHGLADTENLLKEIDVLRRDLAAARERTASSEKNLEESQSRQRSLLAERERLLAVVKGAAGGDEAATAKPSVQEAKDLLEEEDEDTAPKVGDEVAALKAEENGDLSTGSSLLPEKKPGVSPKPVRPEEKKAKDEADAPKRPQTYEVKEGDTLYGISRRFYGSIKDAKRIREANKANISTDGRVRVGDILTLP